MSIESKALSNQAWLSYNFCENKGARSWLVVSKCSENLGNKNDELRTFKSHLNMCIMKVKA